LYHVDGFAEVVLVRERCLKLNAEAEEKVGTVILILKLLLSTDSLSEASNESLVGFSHD